MIKRILYYKRSITFFLLMFISLSFLIFQPGVWAYLDASYQRTVSYNIRHIFSSVFNVTGYGYNGDRSQLISGRYIQLIIELLFKSILGVKWGAIIFFSSYFCINYFTTKSILSKLIGGEYSSVGALFYTFNPLSLYMLNQVGFIYAYSAAPLIILGIIQFFYKKDQISRWLGLFILCLGTIFFTSYARFMLIYIVLFGLLALFYYKEILTLLSRSIRQVIIVVSVIICTILPFIFSFLYPHYSGESNYFAGMGNYTTALRGRGGDMYSIIKATPVPQLISPQEPSPNILTALSNNTIFIYLSLIYFCFVIYFVCMRQNILSKKEKKVLSIGLTLVTMGIISRLLPYYVPEDIFISISYDILPFLANTSGFAFRFFIAGFSILIPLGIQRDSPKIGNIILYGGLVYCFFVVSNLIFFEKNPKLGTIDITEDNPIYDVIQGNDIPSIQHPQAALLYPNPFLLFNWAPYPLDLAHIPGLLSGIEGNERTSTAKQVNLSRYISQPSVLSDNLTNLGLLTISSFLVMQNISNNEEKIQFDRYNDNDYIGLANQADSFLSNYDKVYLADTNALYKKYDIKDISLFSFLLYLPKSMILLSGYNNIFDTGFDLLDRPFLLDDIAYNKPGYLNGEYIIPYFTGQTISIKTRRENASAYYMELGNIQPGQDVLLQFNKTFSPSRKIKYINKKTYESLGCNWTVYYPISDNTYCHSSNSFPTAKEFFDVLFSSQYENVDHFEGNIIGNTWIIKDIDNVDPDGNVYILLSYDKQYLFIITQLISLLTLLVLLSGALFNVFTRSSKSINTIPKRSYTTRQTQNKETRK